MERGKTLSRIYILARQFKEKIIMARQLPKVGQPCHRSMIAPPQHFPRACQFVPNHQRRKEKKENDVGKMVCAPSTEKKNKISE